MPQSVIPSANTLESWFYVTQSVRGEAPVLGYITGNAETEDDTPDGPFYEKLRRMLLAHFQPATLLAAVAAVFIQRNLHVGFL